MKVNLVERFKPAKYVVYKDNYGNVFQEKAGSKIHISQNIREDMYCRINMLRDDMESLAKNLGHEFKFVNHKNSDKCLMNFGPFTAMFDNEICVRDLLDLIQNQVKKIKKH